MPIYETYASVFRQAQEIDAAIVEVLAQPGHPVGKWARYDLISVRAVLASKTRSLEIILEDLTLTEPERRDLAEQKSSELEQIFWQARELLQNIESLLEEVRVSKMQVEGEAPSVFLSYAREDERRARSLYNKLRDGGFKPWIDKEDILPGEEWEFSIRQAVRKSDFLVVCLSNSSVGKRGYVQRELRIALEVAQELPEGSIFLIPVRFDKCAVPDSLSKYQYVDLFGGDGLDPSGLDKLILAITTEWDRRTGRSS